MRRATLLYNPHSGNSRQRLATIERIATALRHQGLDVTTLPTAGPNTAGQQASQLDALRLLMPTRISSPIPPQLR